MRTCPTSGLGISRSTISKSAPPLGICATFIVATATFVAINPPFNFQLIVEKHLPVRIWRRRFVGDTEQADMESKPCLYISGCVEAALEQFSNSRLRRGAPQRSGKRVPLQSDLCVGRQTIQINQAFRLCDRFFVERRNPRSKRVNERV